MPAIVYNIGGRLKKTMFGGKQAVTGTQQIKKDTRKRMLHMLIAFLLLVSYILLEFLCCLSHACMFFRRGK